MPARDEMGAASRTPGAPPHIVFVRMPAGAPRQPGEPPLEKSKARRSPAKRRRGKQEKKRMIKLALAVAIAIAAYVALGMVPLLGHVAITVPLLAALPAVGAWACFLTFKGIASLALFSYVGRKLG